MLLFLYFFIELGSLTDSLSLWLFCLHTLNIFHSFKHMIVQQKDILFINDFIKYFWNTCFKKEIKCMAYISKIRISAVKWAWHLFLSCQEFFMFEFVELFLSYSSNKDYFWLRWCRYPCNTVFSSCICYTLDLDMILKACFWYFCG